MSFLKEVLQPKPIAESVTGIKLYRIEEALDPGTEVVYNGHKGVIKKELKRFSGSERMYMIVHPGRKVSVATESELDFTK